MPTTTVIIPAFNAEQYIGEALESIRRQTLQDLEVVVVDDGSTDGTLQAAATFDKAFELTVLQQANAGPAAARNVGIRRARGRYCAFLDADDLMLPDRLAAQTALLAAEPDLGLVHSDLMTFDARGVIHRTRRVFSDPCGGMVLDRLLLDNFITTSTVMAPKERLLDAGLFDEGRCLSEDFELWLRMAARWKVGYVERPLVQYRYRNGSLSGNKLQTSQAALEVIQGFWRDHADYRRTHRRVHRRSLARHLATAGVAALVHESRSAALTYLLKSLVDDPWNITAWKWLSKALLAPPRRLGTLGEGGSKRLA